MSKANPAKKAENSRFLEISTVANVYGERSFDNYAKIRSVAETIRDSLCTYLDSKRQCVFLVPPQGPFGSQNYGSAAFSVSGKGFLPLEPIAFGLAVRVTESGDFIRLILHCRKEGERVFVQVEEHQSYELDLPITEHDLHACLEGLYQHLLHWFTDRVERYDHGHYGTTDIGFDIHRAESDT